MSKLTKLILFFVLLAVPVFADSSSSFYRVPAGQVAYFAGASCPTGWLAADGVAVSRSTYARLFAKLSTTYGSGNGSTTFNTPDLRGEFIRGLDGGRGVDAGRTLGSFQADDFKSHVHTEQLHQGSPGTDNGPYAPGLGALTTQDSGATGGTETRPRNVALTVCISY